MMVWAVSLSTMKLIPHCLTAIFSNNGIQSLIDFGRLVGPLDHSVLYHRCKTDDANPQTISGRTSYIRVRLAFHHYPQLIQVVFNQHWFGPSRGFTRAAPCPWVDHSVSGVSRATAEVSLSPYSDSLSLRLRFCKLNLAAHGNSQDHSTKGTPSPCIAA